MEIEPSSAAGNGNANNSNKTSTSAALTAQATDEVSWSKIGIRAGGVNVKSLRYTTRSRGKSRGPRIVVEVGAAARSHGEAGKANKNSNEAPSSSKTSFLFPVNPKNKKRRRTNIFTRHG